MTTPYLHMLCHQVVAAHDKGGETLAIAIENLRIAMSGKTKQEYTNELDNTPVMFGKYKGHSPEEIAVIDPGYILWMYANVKPTRCSKELRDGCEYEINTNQTSEHDRRPEWEDF